MRISVEISAKVAEEFLILGLGRGLKIKKQYHLILPSKLI
jgi:hypothetical protein